MTTPFQTPPADSLRSVLRRVFESSEYDWELPRDPFRFFRELYSAFLEWLDQLQQAHPVVFYVLMGLLTGLLLAILAHFGYLVWRALRPRAEAEAVRGRTVARPRDAAWHLGEARRLAREGQYAEALARRFSALVLELDGRKMLKFHPAKTPAEYIFEARLDGTGRSSLTGLVNALYKHLFGGVPCTAEDVHVFDRQAADLVAYGATS